MQHCSSVTVGARGFRVRYLGIPKSGDATDRALLDVLGTLVPASSIRARGHASGRVHPRPGAH